MRKKLGEMKRAMDYSMDFINSVDIQNGILTDKGQQMLDAYNQGEFKLITLDSPSEKRIELNPSKDSNYKGLLD